MFLILTFAVLFLQLKIPPVRKSPDKGMESNTKAELGEALGPRRGPRPLRGAPAHSAARVGGGGAAQFPAKIPPSPTARPGKTSAAS